MRKAGLFLLFPLLIAFLGTSCGKDDKSEVSRAAEAYYSLLIRGEYEAYVDGIAYADSMTESYRSQMVDLLAQYAARERALRGGLVSAHAVGDTVSGDVASVFLEVVYGDSTREEVSLPMVKCGERWKMQ